jgi:hypothetical protein
MDRNGHVSDDMKTSSLRSSKSVLDFKFNGLIILD